jgi:hypothetical protein
MAQAKPLVVWYEPHPVTPARKKELVAAGYRIVDARYAPPGWVRPGAPAPAEAPLGFMGTDASASVVEPASFFDIEAAEAAGQKPWAEHEETVTTGTPTSAELRAKLDAAGIAYMKHAPKAKLLELAAGL